MNSQFSETSDANYDFVGGSINMSEWLYQTAVV